MSPTHIITSGTLPTTCTVGDIYEKTGASAGPYHCSATDTWTAIGTGSGVTPDATLTASLPLIGAGTTHATVGTRSGNTTKYVTTTGTLTSGDCVKIDASGNFIANGSTCASGGGSGAYTASGYTLSTAKVLGRTTAGTG